MLDSAYRWFIVKKGEIFWSHAKVDLHSANFSRATDSIRWWMVFFQFTFEANEMFCLLNKFVVFINQKQPLKRIQLNSYLDLWSSIT